MIKEHEKKIKQIVECIKNNRIQEIDEKFGNGPELYFYKKVINLRNGSKNIESFLRDERNLEIVYATLVAWGMNSQAAKMKYFDEFKANILSCKKEIEQLESFWENGNIDMEEMNCCLRETYEKLHLMKGKAKLVSNSKLLHFLFPEKLMPMDGKHTLHYFNAGESVNKYLEIIEFSFEIMDMEDNWQKYLSGDWNTTVPKMIDNAIILLVGKSACYT
ncbi:MAG: hypothetical protein WBC22_07110 [Sedimentisphaerales bacterium]